MPLAFARYWRSTCCLRETFLLRQIHSTARCNGSHSSARPATSEVLQTTRNIGIIAHIDAGKTTTTERMLYYSGFTRRIGNVDEGSTVTDFLPAERARGITIQSAAVTFNWPPLSALQTSSNKETPDTAAKTTRLSSEKPHLINLIDTPGHADFTFEVLRSLRILDGAVCILDGVAGVEAQTEKVWAQADLYQIPRIIFINKLDRTGAAFGKTVREVGARLHGWPALCQIPWWKDGTEELIGVGDVVNMRSLAWQQGGDGRMIETADFATLSKKEPKFAEEIHRARVALVELLSEYDDLMVEKFLEHDEDFAAVPPFDVMQSLRRCVLQSPQRVFPIFAGASFRNVGVQPLLDAVVNLLPSPAKRPAVEISLGEKKSNLQEFLSGGAPTDGKEVPLERQMSSKTPKGLAKGSSLHEKILSCALAFKVVNDSRRGVLIYVRVYSGSITRNTSLFNTNLGISEKALRLCKMYANEAVDVDSIEEGQIGVIIGLKYVRTGDTLISYAGNPKNGPPPPIKHLQLRPITAPPPVFFTCVEPKSLSEEKPLADSLQVLLREDPSLRVTHDPETGQMHLAGMGELHLEIALDRLLKDFKAKATSGKIEIGYREAISAASAPCTEVVDREIAGGKLHAACTASVDLVKSANTPIEDESRANQKTFRLDSNILLIKYPTINENTEASDTEDVLLPNSMSLSTAMAAIQTGVAAALSRGPTYGFPMHSAYITIELDDNSHIFPDTTAAALSNVTRQATRVALKQTVAAGNESVVMEPVMHAAITVNESDLGKVVQDLSSSRGGQVLSLDNDETGQMTSSYPSGYPPSALKDISMINVSKIYAPQDPFAGASGQGEEAGFAHHNPMRQITALVPLKEMVGYLRHLRSLTAGRGTFIMSVDQYEKMSTQRTRALMAELRGDGM